MTFIGHSTFLLQMVASACSPTRSGHGVAAQFHFWAERVGGRTPSAALPGIDLLLVTHNHYDHMDLPTLRRVRARWAPQVATAAW